MDSSYISWVIDALASGATFVTLSVAREEIVVKYRSLKEFIGEKLGLKIPVAQLERGPTEERQKSLAENLEYAIEVLPETPQERENVINELLDKTKAVTDLLEKVPQAELDAVGIDLDLEKVKAVNFKVGNIISEGGAKVLRLGIKAKDSKLRDFTVGDITVKGDSTAKK